MKARSEKGFASILFLIMAPIILSSATTSVILTKAFVTMERSKSICRQVLLQIQDRQITTAKELSKLNTKSRRLAPKIKRLLKKRMTPYRQLKLAEYKKRARHIIKTRTQWLHTLNGDTNDLLSRLQKKLTTNVSANPWVTYHRSVRVLKKPDLQSLRLFGEEPQQIRLGSDYKKLSQIKMELRHRWQLQWGDQYQWLTQTFKSNCFAQLRKRPRSFQKNLMPDKHLLKL